MNRFFIAPFNVPPLADSLMVYLNTLHVRESVRIYFSGNKWEVFVMLLLLAWCLALYRSEDGGRAEKNQGRTKKKEIVDDIICTETFTFAQSRTPVDFNASTAIFLKNNVEPKYLRPHGIISIENSVPRGSLLDTNETLLKKHHGNNFINEFTVHDDHTQNHDLLLSAEDLNEEESELCSAFDETMKYTTANGASVNNQAKGKIHSIIVHEKQSSIRYARSPTVRVHSSSSRGGAQVNVKHIRAVSVVDVHPVSADKSVRLIVNFGGGGYSHVKEHSSGKTAQALQNSPAKPPETKPIENTVEKLAINEKRKITQLQRKTAEVTDLKVVVKRRKQVDTMHDRATLLGHLSNREQKLYGAKRPPLSQRWKKVQKAVRQKLYLNFNDKPM